LKDPDLTLSHNEYIIHLDGIILADVGNKPTLKLSSFLNGSTGPSDTGDLCGCWLLEVQQDGEIQCPPKKGPVKMSWTRWIPTYWMESGFHRIRAEMYTTNWSRMMDYESTMWIQGGN
jgi:hypothetical protein